MQAILRLLAHETARADAAERELAKDNEAVITRVQSLKEAHMRTEAELARVTAELNLYKIQLDLAQQEIFRAQSLLDEVERSRVEVEERGIKDREKLRKLALQRAMDEAREEGRREGLRLGLERGRKELWVPYREDSIHEEEEEEEVATPPPPRQRAPATQSSVRSSRENARNQPKSTPVVQQPVEPVAPQVVDALPIVAPIPVVASTYLSRPPGVDVSPIPPPRIESPSPSLASRHSNYSVPPDGYIPTIGPDAHISLPPPHELSTPLELTIKEPASGAGPSSGNVQYDNRRGTENNVPRDARNERAFSSHPYRIAVNHQRAPPTQYEEWRVGRNGRETPALSTISHESSRISQYDIVGPPVTQAFTSGMDRGTDRGTQISPSNQPQEPHYHIHTTRLTPQRIVEDWRSANLDIFAPSPQPGIVRRIVPTFVDSTRSADDEIRSIYAKSRSPTDSSEGTVMDPVLLTPDHANRPTPLPNRRPSQLDSSLSAGRSPDPVIVDELPPGFVALSPIPGQMSLSPGDLSDQRNAEQFRGGYQIYAGTPVIPEKRIQISHEDPSTLGSSSGSSILFRPSTTESSNLTSIEPDPGKMYSQFNSSPAPLNRPFSIFSDD
ncbi:hypothetical protein H0H81_008326 [Sphagnurus paluster]|uniref:Uncharacterized protein n=1 Tax=Sphagnurus paluster TaxID=117069 RepID=A0A9P7KP03_9AGAR|nr:hypothetical protein H0H81_008326 [Sphagnurus paluster]